MATISTTFSDNGTSDPLRVPVGDKFSYTYSGTYTGSLVLERSDDAINYAPAISAVTDAGSGVSGSATVEVSGPASAFYYRFRYYDHDSGTVAITLSDVEIEIDQIKDKRGLPVLSLKEDALELARDLRVPSGKYIYTEEGVGAKNGATVTVAEYGDAIMHKTVLTLASTPVSVVSVTTGNGVGGTKLYDFPAGHINVLGCIADLSLAVETEADFTDATPEGDVGIGSAAPANADALGTDATDDNMATATAFTMDTYAATVKCPPDATAVKFDGTSTALDAYVNVLVDAADIDNDVTTNVLVSGTVTIHWLNMGDY